MRSPPPYRAARGKLTAFRERGPAATAATCRLAGKTRSIVWKVRRPVVTQDADGEILVDDDHRPGPFAAQSSSRSRSPRSGSASTSESSAAWNSSIRSPVVMRRNSSLPSWLKRGSPLRRRHCSRSSSPMVTVPFRPNANAGRQAVRPGRDRALKGRGRDEAVAAAAIGVTVPRPDAAASRAILSRRSATLCA